MENQLPERAQLKRAVKQLASTLPPLQYSYKGIMTGDAVKDDLKLKRTKSGEAVKREDTYEVNRYNFVNHERRLKKIIKNAKSQEDMEQQVNAYIESVKVEYEQFKQLHPVKKLNWLHRFIAFLKKTFLN